MMYIKRNTRCKKSVVMTMYNTGIIIRITVNKSLVGLNPTSRNLRSTMSMANVVHEIRWRSVYNINKLFWVSYNLNTRVHILILNCKNCRNTLKNILYPTCTLVARVSQGSLYTQIILVLKDPGYCSKINIWRNTVADLGI